MKNFKYLFIFIVSFLSAGVLWTIVSFFLPKLPFTYIPQKFNGDFYNINLNRIFVSEDTSPKQIEKQSQTKTTYSLDGIKLKAVYNDGKKAFIILDDKGKSVFLDLNQVYNGYKLVKVYNSYVVFVKNSKNYVLSFETSNKKIAKISRKIKKIPEKETISKKTIDEYKNNFSKIWNEIGIIRVKNGYKITYVKKGGIFDKLGLKRGDIIIKVNGTKLTNDAQAWNLYKNIDKFDNLEIEIKRNNKTKVINYEIN
jgi:general secretion pathway protein C